MKKVLNVFKRLGSVYMKGVMEMYGPCIKYNIPINI